MRVLLGLFIVIVAVSSVRSQGRPPTQTKKGPPPPSHRRNDNPDVGLPSGKDVPDGRYRRPVAGPPPAAAPAAPPAAPVRPRSRGPPPAAGAPRRNDNPDVGLPSGKDVPDGRYRRPVAGPPPAAAPAAPPAAPVRPRSQGPPPAAGAPRRNDNPDVGLPSGKDVPDGRHRRPVAGPPPGIAAAPPAAPPAHPAVISRPTKPRSRYNDNPDISMAGGADYPDGSYRTKTRSGTRPARPLPAPLPVPAYPEYNVYPAAPPAAPPAAAAPLPPPMPAYCSWCPMAYAPMCGMDGNTYDNECLLSCANQQSECDGPCPCTYALPPPAAYVPPAPAPVSTCGCSFEDYNDDNPVCSEDDVQYLNACRALCDEATILCSSHCPC